MFVFPCKPSTLQLLMNELVGALLSLLALTVHSLRETKYSPYYYRTIYEKLGGAVPDNQKAVYAQRVDEMVPNIRYCAYNIGGSTDIAELVKLRPDAPGFDMLASKIDVSYSTQVALCYCAHDTCVVKCERQYMCTLKGGPFTLPRCECFDLHFICMRGAPLLVNFCFISHNIGRSLKDARESSSVTERGDVAGPATASQERETPSGTHQIAAVGGGAG